MGKEQQNDIGILNLGDNLLYLMYKWDLTVVEMARRCDVSTRKFCEIIYKEPKGLRLSTLRAISGSLGISIGDLIDKNLRSMERNLPKGGRVSMSEEYRKERDKLINDIGEIIGKTDSLWALNRTLRFAAGMIKEGGVS